MTQKLQALFAPCSSSTHMTGPSLARTPDTDATKPSPHSSKSRARDSADTALLDPAKRNADTQATSALVRRGREALREGETKPDRDERRERGVITETLTTQTETFVEMCLTSLNLKNHSSSESDFRRQGSFLYLKDIVIRII